MPGGLPGSAEVDGGSFVLFAVMRGQARGGTMSFAEYDALLARTTAPAFDEVGKLTKDADTISNNDLDRIHSDAIASSLSV